MPPKVKLCPTPDQPSVYNIVKNSKRRRRKSSQCHSPATKIEPNVCNDQDIKKRTPPTPPIRCEDREVKRSKAEMNTERKTQEEEEEEDFLGELTPEMKKLDLLIKRNLRHELKPLKKDIADLVLSAAVTTTHTNEILSLKQENTVLRHKCNQLEQEQKALKDRLDKIENLQLENNLILHGVEESTAWEYPETRYAKVIEHLSHTMNAETAIEQRDMARNLSIKKTHRIGKFNVDRCRPVSITFAKYEDVEYLLGNKRYLPKGVYLNREYSSEIESKRKLLRPILKIAKQHADYKDRCYMEEDYLKIKGKKYTVDNIHQLPDEINGYKASTKREGDITCFYGELNPLSNFHKASFEIDGTLYSSSEQYIQQQKAIFFGDKVAEAKIMAACTPMQCKKEGRFTRNFNQDTWNNNAKAQCFPGIEAKFTQNDWLSKLLISTADETLAEASYDELWGTGKHFFHKDCTTRNKWTSVGILGEILMEIRAKLKLNIPPVDTVPDTAVAIATTPAANEEMDPT